MISIESFTRARELVNRIDNIDAQITRSFTENERTYESISEIINIDNISTIINNFSMVFFIIFSFLVCFCFDTFYIKIKC